MFIIRCVDDINAFHCICNHGYEGLFCDNDIDECDRYAPCKFATACLNLPGDYSCDCTSRYGGKNCSVELIGCTNHRCQNAGECVPFLIGESQHNYTCTCPYGFHGYFCEISTTISFTGKADITVPPDQRITTNYSLSLRFRTTLPNGILAWSTGKSHTFVLELSGGELYLDFDSINGGTVLKPTMTDEALSLVDAQWQQVNVGLLSTGLVVLTVTHHNNPFTPVTVSTLVSPSFDAFEFGVTYIGGDGGYDVESIGYKSENFTGCMQDVIINDYWITPEDILGSSDIQVGCNRCVCLFEFPLFRQVMAVDCKTTHF